MWSTDGSAPGPGPTLTPDLQRRDGTLWPSPETDYALAYNGTALQAPVAKRIGGTILYRLDGKPLKLAYSQSGVFSDGWMGRTSSYNRFTAAKDGPGYAQDRPLPLRLLHDRADPGGVLVKIGPIAIGSDKQAHIGHVTDQSSSACARARRGAERAAARAACAVAGRGDRGHVRAERGRPALERSPRARRPGRVRLPARPSASQERKAATT